MDMLEFFEVMEAKQTEEIKFLQKQRRVTREAIMKLKSQELKPVAEESSGGNKPCICTAGEPRLDCPSFYEDWHV